jgi:Tol biopolymer transport system component
MSDIYTISADGGEPKQLTNNPSEDHVPCYSADGRWIFFASLRTGTRQLYRMPSGGGPEVQLTHKGAYSPIGSPDNRWLYYHKPIGGLSKVPIDGGEEVSVLPQRTLVGNPLNWGVSASGIYFIGQANADAAGYPIKLYRFSDGKIEGVGALTSSPMLHFGISPDEKWMLYTQSDSALNDLMLVENFQ